MIYSVELKERIRGGRIKKAFDTVDWPKIGANLKHKVGSYKSSYDSGKLEPRGYIYSLQLGGAELISGFELFTEGSYTELPFSSETPLGTTERKSFEEFGKKLREALAETGEK